MSAIGICLTGAAHSVMISVTCDLVVNIFKFIHAAVFIIRQDLVPYYFKGIKDKTDGLWRLAVPDPVLNAFYPYPSQGIAFFKGIISDALKSRRQFQMLQ
jgi:hypothetical protein